MQKSKGGAMFTGFMHFEEKRYNHATPYIPNK